MDELTIAKAIVRGLIDPAVLLDRDFKLLGYNSRFVDLTGLRRRALAARLAEVESPMTLVADAGTAEREHAEICLRSKKPIMLAELPVKNAAGADMTVHITFIPIIDTAGEAVGLVEVVRDVSGEARVQGRYHELLAVERLRAEHLEREVEKRTRELTAALEQVTRLSREDPLTGLLNRRAFTEHAEMALKHARRHHRSAGVLVTDLDFFKRVNDTYGHQAGDAVLVEMSKLLKDAVRETDFVARFGGEEFVVLLTETVAESVAVTGERLREMVEKLGTTEPVPGVKFPTASIGMAIFPDHGDSLDDLVSKADSALYEAKETGRNKALMFDIAAKKKEAASTRVEILPRALIAASGGLDADAYRKALEVHYEVVVAHSGLDAVERCRRERFDVLLADFASADDGVELLRQSLRVRPEALRVLVIDTEDVFVEVRGTNVARVDCFLLRREGPSNIGEAIDNALARRELDRQRMMLDNDDVRKLYASRLSELDDLLERRALDFAYQPIVDPRSRKVRAYEALCRARHPVFKNATVLFEAAVQSGNLWRLGRLCRELAVTGAGQLPDDVKLFVNLHPGEIDDPELVDWKSHGVPSSRVVFEITERTAIPDFRRFRDTSKALGSRGFEFAIDDLGAGYASLNAVALLEPSYVKIDMTMIRGIDRSTRRQHLIRRMVQYADDVGIEIIAEGIESEAEAASVADMGCHMAQGFYFGRPVEGKPGSGG